MATQPLCNYGLLWLRLLGALAALGAAAMCEAQGEPGPRPGLLLEYRLDGDLQDSSGQGHHGNASGGPVFAPGKRGQCLSFSGKGDFIDSGTNLAELTDAFTVSLWVNPSEHQNHVSDVFGNHGPGGTTGVVMQQIGGGNDYTFNYGTGSECVSTRAIRLVPGKWQHLTVVKDPREVRVFINGVLVDSTPARGPMATSTTNFLVGHGYADNVRYFAGMIDELRVWDEAVTVPASEISDSERAEALCSLRLVTARLSPDGGHVELGIGERAAASLPDAVQEVAVSLDLAGRGRDDGAPSARAVLRRDAGFRASVALPAAAGYVRLRYRPTITFQGQELSLMEGHIGAVVQPSPVQWGAARQGGTATLASGGRCTGVTSLDGPGWLIATDPQNTGRNQEWWEAPVEGARETRVPWVTQDIFPEYHGVAWYWRRFSAPPNPHAGGRCLLRFQAVDYLADVWVNGAHVGTHEGGETPFVLDATAALKPGEVNLLAVRVLNPTHEPIDGIALGQTPHGCKTYPLSPGGIYNVGGIVDSVDLLLAPAVRVEDLFLKPDPKTGVVRVEVTLRNASDATQRGLLWLSVAPAAGGESLDATVQAGELAPGDTRIGAELRVSNPHLWDLNDPYLYQVTARVSVEGSGSFDDRTARCGFRELRFEDGYFRLNGRRVYLYGPLDLRLFPVGYNLPHDPDLLRRTVLSMKMMGYSICRLVFGGTSPRQLDIFDELGVMVYQESYATWQMQESPRLEELFDRSWAELIRRDRNHPSIVAWGLLNETAEGRLFRHAVDCLGLVRSLDDTRLVSLSSGRWDNDYTIGSLSNPGSDRWETPLRDVHMYPPVPHTEGIIQGLRTLGSQEAPVLLSEYGTGCADNLARFARHYEQLGAEYADDARYYRDKLDRFMADWERWRLGEIWARPEDFFTEAERNMARLRIIGGNAIRSNPHIVSHFTCAIADSDFDGCGVINAFREPKPGSTDAVFDLTAKLRWCLFAEPVSVYRGATVKLEAVLSNQDALRPGDYPVSLQVLGPGLTRVLQRTVTVTIPDPQAGPELPLALPVFSEDLRMDGLPGTYRFLATFDKGGAATGGDIEFHVADPKDMPPITPEVVLLGDDPEMAQWLGERGVRVRAFAAGEPAQREVILVPRPAGASAEALRELGHRASQGSTGVILCPEVLAGVGDAAEWGALAGKAAPAAMSYVGGYYRAETWARAHPIFQGLPAGGMMDPNVYREVLPQVALPLGDEPAEVVAGAINGQLGYFSGSLVSVHQLGAGRVVLSTLLIRENLGRDPVAERLLRNMLNYAVRNTE